MNKMDMLISFVIINHSTDKQYLFATVWPVKSIVHLWNFFLVAILCVKVKD